MNATTTNRPLALVTGASSGIGLELARQFAEHGFDLILAAEDGGLDRATSELAGTGAELETVTVDLTKPEDVKELYDHVRSAARPLDAAALNAGIGAGGEFASGTDADKELELIDLNVRSTVQLAKYVANDMRARGQGRILFTSSIASTMAGPFHAVYNASKSFVQSFALALRDELKDSGVVVTTLMPGATDTNFFERGGLEDTAMGAMPKDDPAAVARQGYEALMEGRERVIASSPVSKLQGRASRVLSDSAKAKMHRAIAQPGSAAGIRSARRLLAAAIGGTTTAARSLPIRCSADEVERLWGERRSAVLDGLPVRAAHIIQGSDQGEWGTTWTIRAEFSAPLPKRAAQTLAGKAIRRLKAVAETGEIPTTARNPSYRGDAGQGERHLQEVSA